MFIRELLALYVYNYFEMINPTCSFSLPLSFGRLKYAVDSNALKVMHFSKGLVAKNKQYTGFYFTIRVWPVCV